MKELILCLLLITAIGTNQSTYAQYTETTNAKANCKHMQKDFGLTDDNASTDQSRVFQKAIDAVSKQGGGNIIVEKGTYKLANVYMKSNVHLLIEGGTVLKPVWETGTKVVMFVMGVNSKTSKSDPKSFIENVSIRGINGKFIVDYHDRVRVKGEGARAINLSMVHNFLIENMDIKDNYTTYCGMCLSPYRGKKNKRTPNIEKWDVSRPTDGTIRNCRIFRGSPGYGLVQLHGARRVYFEELYALGGVTLRLETGANNGNVGVFDITGDKIVNEKGRCAIMFGPHSAKNGIVSVKNVLSIGSTFAVKATMAGVKKDAPDQTPGYFENITVKNIHAVFGKEAQVKKQNLLAMPTAYFDDLKIWPDNKFLDGPSIAATLDDSELYDVNYENVTLEGFEFFSDKPTITKNDIRKGNPWKEYDTWYKSHNSAAFKTDKATVITEYKIPKSTVTM